MLALIDLALENLQAKGPEQIALEGQIMRFLDQLVPLASILDQCGDRYHLEPEPLP